jgi:hypothetical protein
MAAIDYAGLNHDLYFGDKTGKNFKQVLGVNDLDFDNDKDEVTRDFIDGTNLKLIKSFKSTIKFKVTDIGQDNLKNIVPGYVYDSGETIDGTTGVTVGAKGAVQVGLQKGSSTQVPGIFKLVPKLAAQAGHTLFMLDAMATLSDISQEDGLTEFEISVTGKLVKGDLTFA